MTIIGPQLKDCWSSSRRTWKQADRRRRNPSGERGGGVQAGRDRGRGQWRRHGGHGPVWRGLKRWGKSFRTTSSTQKCCFSNQTASLSATTVFNLLLLVVSCPYPDIEEIRKLSKPLPLFNKLNFNALRSISAPLLQAFSDHIQPVPVSFCKTSTGLLGKHWLIYV